MGSSTACCLFVRLDCKNYQISLGYGTYDVRQQDTLTIASPLVHSECGKVVSHK